MKHLLLVVFLFGAGLSVKAAPIVVENPPFVLNAMHVCALTKLPLADPFVLYHDNKYYAYGTSDARSPASHQQEQQNKN
ncbi:MAG: hypothetical protein LBR97_06030 [Dysgonamonadaceae bacterium]|jgi:hypothetical protein|nr:hypothetical protein [Dysgonamonadaceae bacterium]